MIRTLISNTARAGRIFGALAFSASLLSAQNFKASKVEVDLSAGGAGFHRRPDPLRTKLTNSGLLGFHITENIWNHWSLEQSFTSTIGADLLLSRAPDVNFMRQDFNQRTRTFMFNPVYNFTERTARIRPFVTMGMGAISYSPTSQAKDVAIALRPYPAANLDTSTKFGVNYGGGLKARITDLISLRFDIRGLTSGAPTFGLPSTGPVGSFYIPNTGRAHSIQTSGGIGFNFGGDAGGGASAPSPTTSRVFRLDSIAANPAGPIKPGSSSLLTTKLTDSKNSRNVVWEWTVNGVPQPNAKGPEFRFDPTAAGTYVVKVTATDGKTSASESYTMVVEEPKARVFKLDPIQSSSSSILTGESAQLSTKLNDSANSPTTVYEWTVNGVKQEGANGPTFRFTPPGPGTYTITVTAKDGDVTSTETFVIVVKEATPLTLTSAADKLEVKAGDPVGLTAQGTQSDYSGKLTYNWKASEGTITPGSNGSATLNTGAVQFDPAGQFRPQNKAVTLTASVTDERGRTATAAPITVRVTRDPQTMRLDDVIFGNGSTRVNNCGKRILIDELAAIVNNNPDVEVLLIGHKDSAEHAAATVRRTKNGKRITVAAANGLDRERVLNVAAVISAGTGICGNCALERIKVDWVGTDQTSEHRAGFCGTSSRNKSEERPSDEVAADDAAAKNRRVEIWIVPKGGAMPGAAKAPKPAPMSAIKSRGCPK